MAAAVVLSLNLAGAFAFVVTPVNPKPRLQLRSLAGTTFVQPDHQRCVYMINDMRGGESQGLSTSVFLPTLFPCCVHVMDEKTANAAVPAPGFRCFCLRKHAAF